MKVLCMLCAWGSHSGVDGDFVQNLFPYEITPLSNE